MAGQLAGFNVLQIINEATAAALAYGLDILAIGNQSGFTEVEVGNLASTARGHQCAAQRFPIILATTSGLGSLVNASKAAEPRA